MRDVNHLIKSDLYRYKGKNSLLKGFKIPGFRYTYFLRKATSNNSFSLKGMVYNIILRHYSYKFGIQIPSGTRIGPGLYIGHFGTIVINGNAIIGNNCNLSHGVTIGQTNRGERKGTPIIGNFVWIGTGSVIVGNINIHDNVLIAPNSYVNFDVPSNSIVIGNPAKIISRNNPTAGYINYTSS